MRVTWQTSEPVRHRAHLRAAQHRRRRVRGRAPRRVRQPAPGGRRRGHPEQAEQPARRVQALPRSTTHRAGHVLAELPAHRPGRAQRVPVRQRRVARRARRRRPPGLDRPAAGVPPRGTGCRPSTTSAASEGPTSCTPASASRPREQRTWSIVGDVEQDAADVVALRDLLARPDELASMLEEDVRANRDGPRPDPGRRRRAPVHGRRAGHRPPRGQRAVQRDARRDPGRRLPDRGRRRARLHRAAQPGDRRAVRRRSWPTCPRR